MGKKATCKKIIEYRMDEEKASKDYGSYKVKPFKNMSKDEKRHYNNMLKLSCEKGCDPKDCTKIVGIKQTIQKLRTKRRKASKKKEMDKRSY